MAQVFKIDSNITGLRISEEDSIGEITGAAVWVPFEPNGYTDFGGELTLLARNPINPSRQRKKGVVTDLDASGGFGTDLTQSNMQSLLQGYFFADLRTKAELAVTDVEGTGMEFEPAAGGDDYVAGDLLFAKGFTSSENNGVFTVSGSPSATAVGVTGTLAAASSQTGTISKVGFAFGLGDLDIDASGNLPVIKISGGSADWTDFNFIAGEWIFIGGDGTNESFATEENNGFARIRSVSATKLTLDKTQFTMVNETGTGQSLKIFYGRVLKNELGTDIKRRTYQIERTLGASDSANPTQIQAEYLEGAVPSELAINIPTADKLVLDLSFVAMNNTQVTSAAALKTGTRPALVESDAFNTSSDFSRIKLSGVSNTSSNPTDLFAFVTDLTITLNNNLSPNKAIGVLGAFEVTAGTFEVGGSLTAYFSNVTAVKAVRDNADITLDAHIVKSNAGITIDVPLIALGNGRLNVEQDQPITLPLDLSAATAAKVDPSLDYTMLMQFWDYLPDAADL